MPSCRTRTDQRQRKDKSPDSRNVTRQDSASADPKHIRLLIHVPLAGYRSRGRVVREEGTSVCCSHALRADATAHRSSDRVEEHDRKRRLD